MKGITQNGVAPYTMRCHACGEEWVPPPVTRGPTKGQITDSSLDKSANDHWKRCKGRSTT